MQSPLMTRILGLALILALAGCASTVTRPRAPSVEDVISLTAAGEPAESIIERMQRGRGLYALSGSELATLGAKGVAPEVLDYMQETYIDAQLARERLRGPHPMMFGPGFGGPWGMSPWFGPWPGYWGGCCW